ncbi:hypothetical protein GCM10020000_45810 [Streptomyces olivoverticillatus]
MRTGFSVETVRAAERALMAELPEGALMQRAAAGLAAACADLLGRRVYGARVALLVGSGDNGGDALYAGARLTRRGAGVTAVLLSADRAHPGGVRALRGAGGRVVSAADGVPVVRRADLVVDGIVGIGGKGGLRAPAEELVRAAEDGGAPILAVDLPSGVDADSGEVRGAAVRADATVTFGAYKPGLLIDPAREYAGGAAAGGHRAAAAGRGRGGGAPARGRGGSAAPPGRRERQVPAGRDRHRRRVGALSGGRRCWRWRARCTAARGRCATWAPRRRR